MSTFSYNYPGLKADAALSYVDNITVNTNYNVTTVPTGKLAIFSYLKVRHTSGSGNVHIKINDQIIKTLTAGQTEIMNNLILGPGANIKVETEIGSGAQASIQMFGAYLKNADV